ncbi:MAG: acylphosphatase [Bacteroidales bacterium]|nr:MAG: acylphosphatase [Bacteroidales bacterium]
MVVSNQIIIRGRVQNVGFRYFAFKTARMLNLKGYVKNEMDGSVYIEAEGNETDMEKFIGALRKGPSWARIEKIYVSPIPSQGFTDFLVK